MDSLPTILSDTGLQLHGPDGSGNRETQKGHQIIVLDEKIDRQSGRFQEGRRWLKGKYPNRGKILWGLTGWETVEEFRRVIPHIIHATEKTAEFRAAALCLYDGNPIVVV